MSSFNVTVYFGNLNKFSVNLINSMFLGDLPLLYSKIIGCEVQDILYIVCNGLIIGEGKLTFSKKICDLNITYNKSNTMHVILFDKTNTNEFDNPTRNKYLQWSSGNNNFTNQSLAYEAAVQLNDVLIVLTSDQLEELLVSRDVIDETEKFCFCDSLESYDTFSELPCGHIFHSHCITNWLTQRSIRCPICAQDIRNIN